MAEKEHENSDTDDSDYAPEEDISEASECGSSEAEDEDNNDSEQKTAGEKKAKSKSKSKGKKRKSRSSKLDEEDEESIESHDNPSGLTAEEEKEKADSLWKSFLSDTATPSKQQCTQDKKVETAKLVENPTNSSKKSPCLQTSKADVTEVSSRNQLKVSNTTKQVSPGQGTSKIGILSKLPTQNNKRQGGISSILSNLNKKTKLSTLEKSKLEWDRFKEENDLKEEINTYNRGKNGYLEKQDFLQRTDTKQFLLEKELRSVSKRNSR